MTIILSLSMLFSITACKKKCEHSYTSSVTKEATCAEEGVKTYTCTKCGDSFTEVIPKTEEHTYTSEIAREATVSETGIKTYTCALCGNSYNEEIEKITGHWNKTDSGYIQGIFDGYCILSASNSDPKVDSNYSAQINLYSSGDLVSITFLEELGVPVSFKDWSIFSCVAKDSNEKEYELQMSLYDSDPYYRLIISDDPVLRKLIETNEVLVLKVWAVKGDSIGVFSVTIDNLGLANVLNE